MHRWLLWLVFTSALVLPHAVRANPPDADAPERLFARAKEHIAQGNYRAACLLLAESLKLDPQTGTLMNLADCEERAGDLVLAVSHWREAIDKLGPSDKFSALARQRAEALDARVPRLTVKLATGAPAGTRVLRDGVELASAALGVPMAVNPGAHEVVVVAPGRQERRTTVTLATGDRSEVTAEPGAEEPAPVVVMPIALPVAPPEPERSFWRKHRRSTITTGAAAVLAGVGGAVGARTWAHYQDLAKTCPGPCSPGDLASLHREQWATNGLFIAAGTAAIAGVVVFVVETRAKGRSVAVLGEGPGARVVVRY